MKKHTIKRIALGLVLAGYATSSAWALVGTSASPIQGQRPVLNADKKDAKPHTVTLKTYKSDGTPHKKGESLRVGETIALSYVLADTDGDLEGDKDNTLTSVQFYHRNSLNDPWKPFPASSVTRKPATQANTKSEVRFEIPTEAEGAKYIGYKILEKTQYGYPAGEQWYRVPDAFDMDIVDLGEGSDKDPNDNIGKPGDPNTGGGGDIGTEVMPPNCDTTLPECIEGVQPGEGTEVRIFAVVNGQVDTTGNYVKDAALFPVVQGEYSAHVFTKDVDESAKYTKYQWKLAGNNAEAIKPAPGQDANNLAISGATAQTYKVGLNSDFSQFTAGAQGFNLQVEVQP